MELSRRSPFMVCLACALVVSTSLAESQNIAPPRDAAPTKPAVEAGDASIHGVVQTPQGQPVRGAVVVVAPSAGQRLGVTTDAEGRFKLEHLQRGHYSLSVVKEGWVGHDLGGLPAAGLPQPVELVGSEPVSARLVMSPGCVLAGRVLASNGEPAGDARILVRRYAFSRGQRRLVEPRTVFTSPTTNDLGEFRVYGLPPGDYYVAASPSEAPGYQGAERLSHVPTFYPGTTNTAQATAIKCSPGREIAGLDFQLQRARSFSVSGVLRAADGSPSSGSVVLVSAENPSLAQFFWGSVGTDGRFRVAGVPGGNYILSAARGSDGTAEVQQPLTVAADIHGLELQRGPGGIISGRVVPEEGLTLTFALPQAKVFALPPPDAMAGFAQASAPVGQDGSFELRGIFSASLLAAFVPKPWRVKSIRVNGADATQVPLYPRPGRIISGVEVTVTNRVGRVEGYGTGEDGKPVPGFAVVAFADDPATWRWNSDMFAIARSDPKGKYRFGTLLPGTYRLLALSQLDPEESGDPEWQRRVRPLAVRVSLSAGQLIVQDLPVLGPVAGREQEGR